MNANTRKLAVLRQLERESEPIALPELLKKLGEGYAERSVRRWLADWVESGRIQKSGQRRSTRYVMEKEGGAIRTRYELVRRAMIRHIIVELLIGYSLEAYIASAAIKLVPDADREAFIEDLWEDLETVEGSGLGVSPNQLQAWLTYRRLEDKVC